MEAGGERQLREEKGFRQISLENLQNHSAIKVQGDNFFKHVNRKTKPPPHAAAIYPIKVATLNFCLIPQTDSPIREI